jgi:hypothetical protein
MLNNDHTELQISLKVPLPPDELFHVAGIPHALKVVEISEIEDVFVLTLPRKVEGKPEIIYYPSKEAPVWVILVYKFATEVIEIIVEPETINLFDVLTQSSTKSSK